MIIFYGKIISFGLSVSTATPVVYSQFPNIIPSIIDANSVVVNTDEDPSVSNVAYLVAQTQNLEVINTKDLKDTTYSCRFTVSSNPNTKHIVSCQLESLPLNKPSKRYSFAHLNSLTGTKLSAVESLNTSSLLYRATFTSEGFQTLTDAKASSIEVLADDKTTVVGSLKTLLFVANNTATASVEYVVAKATLLSTDVEATFDATGKTFKCQIVSTGQTPTSSKKDCQVLSLTGEPTDALNKNPDSVVFKKSDSPVTSIVQNHYYLLKYTDPANTTNTSEFKNVDSIKLIDQSTLSERETPRQKELTFSFIKPALVYSQIGADQLIELV